MFHEIGIGVGVFAFVIQIVEMFAESYHGGCHPVFELIGGGVEEGCFFTSAPAILAGRGGSSASPAWRRGGGAWRRTAWPPTAADLPRRRRPLSLG